MDDAGEDFATQCFQNCEHDATWTFGQPEFLFTVGASWRNKVAQNMVLGDDCAVAMRKGSKASPALSSVKCEGSWYCGRAKVGIARAVTVLLPSYIVEDLEAGASCLDMALRCSTAAWL